MVRIALALLVLAAGTLPTSAETVSRVSIGCDTPEATLMAERALQDKLSGRDRDAFSRIDAYRKQAGAGCLPPAEPGGQGRHPARPGRPGLRARAGRAAERAGCPDLLLDAPAFHQAAAVGQQSGHEIR